MRPRGVTTDNVIARFRRAAIEKGSEGGPRDHELFDELKRAYWDLVSEGSEGRSAFRALLADDSAEVRLWVGAQVLALGDTSVLPILEELGEAPGLLGFSAQMTLREHRARRLRPPFG